jgi:co-chaperonin GroES (HSP10)
MEALAKETEVETGGILLDEPRKARQLPDPRGYKILIALPDPDREFDGGILKSNKTLHEEEIGSIVGMVVKLGPDCYNDKKRFPTGPFCTEGDWIVMRSYSGTRFKIHGKEFRLINDDSVEAVIEDPRGIVKA